MRFMAEIIGLLLIMITVLFVPVVKATEYYEVYGIGSTEECRSIECGKIDEKILSLAFGVQNEYLGNEVLLAMDSGGNLNLGLSVFLHKKFNSSDFAIGGLVVEQTVTASKSGFPDQSEKEFGYGGFIRFNYNNFIVKYMTYEIDYDITFVRTIGIDPVTGSPIREYSTASHNYRTNEIWLGLHYDF